MKVSLDELKSGQLIFAWIESLAKLLTGQIIIADTLSLAEF
jgi:hypothetical protein